MRSSLFAFDRNINCTAIVDCAIFLCLVCLKPFFYYLCDVFTNLLGKFSFLQKKARIIFIFFVPCRLLIIFGKF